jgi:hypothetical protein
VEFRADRAHRRPAGPLLALPRRGAPRTSCSFDDSLLGSWQLGSWLGLASFFFFSFSFSFTSTFHVLFLLLLLLLLLLFLLLVSCAITGARGGGIGRRSPPGSSEESWVLGWAGCGPGGPTWPLGRWARWPVTPTGTGAGSSAPPAGTGGLRPRVFSAHRPWPQLQVHAPARAVTARPLAKRFQTGHAFLLQAIFTIWPDLVPIQTGAPVQIRAAGRSSGTPAVL